MVRVDGRGGDLKWDVLRCRWAAWAKSESRPLAQRAGYEWVTFHTLRKTFATLLDGAGLTAREIADLLGHSNPWTKLNTYMGRGQESRRSAEVLDELVRSDTEQKWQ